MDNCADKKIKPIIFCDFDGTITATDTLVKILDTFADKNWRDIEMRVKNGEIGSRISLVEEFNTFRGSQEAVEKILLDTISITDYFKDFLNFCALNKIEITILSGGFESFIKLIFSKFNINGVKYYANNILFKNNKAEIIYIDNNNGCNKCGHCKLEHITQARKNSYTHIIYIGDGTTDRCPITQCDIVFAKDSLARYCMRNQIPFIPWINFRDIKTYLCNLLSAN
ncbi:MtnX-like HAD-IB family phosphatase [bacterium]|nr:MtnX-like HAD-IB family phosphatase [bacterium]